MLLPKKSPVTGGRASREADLPDEQEKGSIQAVLAASDHGVVTVDLPQSAPAPLRSSVHMTLYKSHAHPPSRACSSEGRALLFCETLLCLTDPLRAACPAGHRPNTPIHFTFLYIQQAAPPVGDTHGYEEGTKREIIHQRPDRLRRDLLAAQKCLVASTLTHRFMGRLLLKRKGKAENQSLPDIYDATIFLSILVDSKTAVSGIIFYKSLKPAKCSNFTFEKP
jgi:hypothetical protein